MINFNGSEYYNSRGVAAILEVGRNKLLSELRKADILKIDNTPCENFVKNHRGFFYVKRGRYNKATTYYSSSALDYIRENFSYIPRKKIKGYTTKEYFKDFSDIINIM